MKGKIITKKSYILKDEEQNKTLEIVNLTI